MTVNHVSFCYLLKPGLHSWQPSCWGDRELFLWRSTFGWWIKILISTAYPLVVLIQFWISCLHPVNIHNMLIKCQVYMLSVKCAVFVFINSYWVVNIFLTTKIKKNVFPKGMKSGQWFWFKPRIACSTCCYSSIFLIFNFHKLGMDYNPRMVTDLGVVLA